MNAFINYLIEANFALLFFLAVYRMFLKNETQFSFNRIYLLTGIAFSLLFPLLHFHLPSGERVVPSISRLLPTYWLPEVFIQANGQYETTSSETSHSIWFLLQWIYAAVAGIFGLLFIFRLARIIQLIRASKNYRWKSCIVSESADDKPTFSFFRFIFIGQADRLSVSEKDEVLQHEWVHVRKFHSFDIILIHILQIVFWFNPFLSTYRKAIVQLHEFEADAHSVENQNVDEYCRLLAKVALQSSGLSLVNHFNYSLTLKRITMMKTLKKKIQGWKMIVLMLTLPLLFFVISCQEQVMSDLQNVNKNSATAGVIPSDVKARLDKLQQENPEKEYVVIQMNEEGKKTLDKLTLDDENAIVHLVRTSTINTDKNSDGGGLTYLILEKGSYASKIVSANVLKDTVYSIADVPPEYVGGMDAMIAYVQKELKYPEDAAKRGIEGKVFVSFVVAKNGIVINPSTMKGLDPLCDQEAVRVISGFPRWTPGKVNGEAVNVKFVLPINFKLPPKNTEVPK